jgi:tagaturonate reductase
MRLCKTTLEKLSRDTSINLPTVNTFELPEKVLQFGTGVLLRALPDYFIDKANKQHVFNGRVVVVKSTDSDSSAFDEQDGLYTICVRGKENGLVKEENIINASISRVLSAKTEWKKILDCAANPEMQIVFSNTTEVGITFVDEKITKETPISFPAKLLAFLIERYKIFNGSAKSGMVIVPTELITDNATKLKNIIVELAIKNNIDSGCVEWIQTKNHFCNSLVDRIVPGKPNKEEQGRLENELGYKDDLLCMSEVFRLWAIEGNETIKNILSFYKIDEAVIIQPDITLFKELKLRLLNGTHTFNCGTAFLSGFNITRDAVTDAVYGKFTKKLMTEIASAIPYKIEEKIKGDFTAKVFERFCNPYINHQWQSITVQYSSKMSMRNVPLLLQYYEQNNKAPMYMATGFAAYLLYMKIVKVEGCKFYGKREEEYYEIIDDNANYFYSLWQNYGIDTLVETVLSNNALWETDLTLLPHFCEGVKKQLHSLMEFGVLETIENLITQNELVNEA